MNLKASQGWILVVEDNRDVWAILKRILPLAFPQMRIVHAADEPTALAYLRDYQSSELTPPRLIFQDFYVPDRTTGLRLVEAFIQPGSPYEHVPLVVMSSSTDEQDKQEVLRMGADSFLVKPARLEEWLAVFQPLRAYWQAE